VVLQETLLRAWQFAPRVTRDGGGNSLLRYALRTGRNLAIDHTRKTARLAPVAEVPEVPVPAVEPDHALQRWVRVCLEALPERAGLALRARLGDQGRSHDRDLAATVEMTLNTFLKNISRARRMLAECLAEHGIEA
jgi:RNA polymerase sigma-70 factor (ECF subfamily)